eukprot:m.12347 g.12347  ORF g.12347 m.12347 type:complete len:56 (-) comp9931_c0_seq1:5-172(-)
MALGQLFGYTELNPATTTGVILPRCLFASQTVMTYDERTINPICARALGPTCSLC